MLAFEFAGGWSDFKGSIAVTVLQFLLGGGGSFSSGGPGASLQLTLTSALPIMLILYLSLTLNLAPPSAHITLAFICGIRLGSDTSRIDRSSVMHS